MKILKKPTKKDAGIGIYKNKVYHLIKDKWYPCGDCKITDKHIQKLIKKLSATFQTSKQIKWKI